MPKKRNFLGGMQNYNEHTGEYEPALVGGNGQVTTDADGDGISHEAEKKFKTDGEDKSFESINAKRTGEKPLASADTHKANIKQWRQADADNEFLRDLDEHYEEIMDDVYKRALEQTDPEKKDAIIKRLGGEITKERVINYLNKKMERIAQMRKDYLLGNLKDVVVDDATKQTYLNDEFKEQQKARTLQKGKKATIVLGAAASGKSSLIGKDFLKKGGYVEVDADIFKEYIPEYHSDPDTISQVHEASSDLSKEFLSKAISQGYNVAIPKLGNTVGSIQKVITKLKDAGYEIELAQVEIDPIENAKRHLARALSTGRLISSDVIGSQYGTQAKAITDTFNELKKDKSIARYQKLYNNKVVERG